MCDLLVSSLRFQMGQLVPLRRVQGHGVPGERGLQGGGCAS
jgi:hypothetical protein